MVVKAADPKNNRYERRTTNEVLSYVNAEKGQAPKGYERPHAR
jgi:hypothetical protein